MGNQDEAEHHGTEEQGHAAALPQGYNDEAALFASPLPLIGKPKTTTRKELWSWYVYYIGNSGLGMLYCQRNGLTSVCVSDGLGPFNFAISAWQNLLYLAGWDPAFPRGTVPCGDGDCYLGAFGQDQSSMFSHTYPGDEAEWCSQFNRLDYKRSIVRPPGSHLVDRGIFCGLWNLETSYYDCVHIPRVGSLVWMARSDQGRTVSARYLEKLINMS